MSEKKLGLSEKYKGMQVNLTITIIRIIKRNQTIDYY